MAKVILIFGIFSLNVFFCCTPKKRNLKTDSVVVKKERTIPYDEDSSSIHLGKNERVLANIGRLMKLPVIYNGTEGLCVRIWVWDFDKNYTINITKDYKGYKCNVFEFVTIYRDSAHQYINIKREWQNLKPKSGWDNFFKKMEEYKILFLENGKIHLERKGSLTHSTYVEFEIAQNNTYRLYRYLEPSYYRYIDSNSKAVYDFLEYVNKEMNVEAYKPARKLFLKPN